MLHDRAERQDGAGTHEERHALQRCGDTKRAAAGGMFAGPEIVPAAARLGKVDRPVRDAGREHRSDEERAAEHELRVLVERLLVGREIEHERTHERGAGEAHPRGLAVGVGQQPVAQFEPAAGFRLEGLPVTPRLGVGLVAVHAHERREG